MTTIDKNGALHDNLGRYADQHQTAADWDLAALGGDLNPPTTEGDIDLKKEDLYRIGAGVAVAAVAVTGVVSCSRNNDAGPPEPGPSGTAPVDTPAPEAGETTAPAPNCEVGTIVAWDDIETVRATLPDGCDIVLTGPEPTPEPAGERHQRSVEWVIAGNDLADFPEKEMVYPDGIVVDTTEPAPTTVGETIPAWQVEAAREAGAFVYVSRRGDGAGLIVDPDNPVLPEQVRADIEDIPSQAVGRDATNEFGAKSGAQSIAMRESGLRAFKVVYLNIQPEHDPGTWSVGTFGFPILSAEELERMGTGATTREGALARAAEVFADLGWGRYEVFG